MAQARRRNTCRIASILYHLALLQFVVVCILYSQWRSQQQSPSLLDGCCQSQTQKALVSRRSAPRKTTHKRESNNKLTEFEKNVMEELKSVKEALRSRRGGTTPNDEAASKLTRIQEKLGIEENRMIQSEAVRDKVMTSPNNRNRNVFQPDDSGSDNMGIPGRCFQDKLFVMGARLTTSYEVTDESVSFDLFAHGVGEGVGFDTTEDGVNRTLLSYKDASQLQLSCQVLAGGGDEYGSIPMEFIPIKSLDSNARGSTLIWRCNVSNVLSKQDMMEHPNGHVRVVVHAQHDKEYVLTASVPVATGSVGYGGPQYGGGPEPSFVRQVAAQGPVGIVLCVAGVLPNGFEYLPEFIQHHKNVGIGQIVIGVDVTHDSPEMNQVRQLTSRFIAEGTVVLSSTFVSGFKGKNTRGLRKFQFYNQCLYHAKGMSEYVAVWDNDELWIPPPSEGLAKNDNKVQSTTTYAVVEHDAHWQGNSFYSTRLSLPEAARSLRGKEGCTDWCFQAFPCFEVHQTNPFAKEHAAITKSHLQKGLYGFEKRDPTPKYARQKSVTKTKRAFSLSMHLGGSCRNAGSEKLVYQQQFQTCPLSVKRNDTHGSMHHFYSLHQPARARHRIWNSTYPKEEYTFEMRSTVMEQLREMA